MRKEDDDTMTRAVHDGWVEWVTDVRADCGESVIIDDGPDWFIAAALREQLRVRLGCEVWTEGRAGWWTVERAISPDEWTATGDGSVLVAQDETEIAALLAALEATRD